MQPIETGTAFVFPGQGSQKIGMGKTVAESWPEAKAVFDEVDDALGEKLSELIWEGNIEDLTLTANAQPALMATSMAILAAIRAEGLPRTVPGCVAGHSLGEYSALCAAKVLDLGDTARLLRIRGTAMQEAVPVGDGAMAAILGLDVETVRNLAGRAAGEDVCQAANDNDPGQVVVSGHRVAVERAVAMAKEHGARRAVLLPVSAPFHCSLMRPAAERMKAALQDASIEPPEIPVLANVTADVTDDPEDVRRLLHEQVTMPVRWRETVIRMKDLGVEAGFEIGSGSALSGMIRRTERTVSCRSVQSADDVRTLVNEMACA